MPVRNGPFNDNGRQRWPRWGSKRCQRRHGGAGDGLRARAAGEDYGLYTEASDLKRRAWGWKVATFLRFALDPATEYVTLMDTWPDKGEVVLRLRGPRLEGGERGVHLRDQRQRRESARGGDRQAKAGEQPRPQVPRHDLVAHDGVCLLKGSRGGPSRAPNFRGFLKPKRAKGDSRLGGVVSLHDRLRFPFDGFSGGHTGRRCGARGTGEARDRGVGPVGTRLHHGIVR